MLDSYEVNVSTLAIIAVNDKLSRIIEKDKEFFINKSTISIIDESCRYYGSTYEGRCDGTKSLLNYSYKLPIIIEESRSLIFFPTSSPKFNTSCTMANAGRENVLHFYLAYPLDLWYTSIVIDKHCSTNKEVSPCSAYMIF